GRDVQRPRQRAASDPDRAQGVVPAYRERRDDRDADAVPHEVDGLLDADDLHGDPPLDPGRRERLVGQGAVGVPGRQVHEVLLREIRDRDRPPTGQRMFGPDGEDLRYADEFAGDQVTVALADGAEEADVRLTGQQGGGDPGGSARLGSQPHLDPRVPAAEVAG